MARVWIEDRSTHARYTQAVAAAKAAGRTPPGRYRVRWYGPDGKPKMKTLTLRSTPRPSAPRWNPGLPMVLIATLLLHV